MIEQPWINRRRSLNAIVGYIDLTHPGPVLIVVFATFALGLVVGPDAPVLTRIGMIIAMLGAQIVIGVANELADRDIDVIAKPTKPLASGRATVTGAHMLLFSGLVCFALGSTLLDVRSFLIGIIGCAVGVSYSIWFKRTMFAWLPYVIAIPLLPIWISVAVDTFQGEYLTAYPIGLFAVAGVQIAQSVGDIDSDRQAGIRSVTTMVGQKRSMQLVWIAMLISAIVLAIVGQGEKVASAVAATVGFGVAADALAYQAHRVLAINSIFPISALGLVLLGIGWVYAIGT